jgi:cell division protein FtsZ
MANMPDNPNQPTRDLNLGPRIVVIGVGGAGGNAVNNMISAKLAGVEFVVANTDAQALGMSLCESRVQMGRQLTQGLGAGSRPDIGRAAAEEAFGDIIKSIEGANMVFITAGMGGGTGTGSAPVVAKAARDAGILTIGVVTKPFDFEGTRRMRVADEGIEEMAEHVDTLIVIPNQNLFRIANEKTTFADAFKMADDVLHAGVRGVTDLMVTPGLINLDFADVRTVMTEMGKAIMGSGEAEGDNRALVAAEAAIANPLLDEVSMKGARGVLINITGGMDLTLFEIDQAANRIREEVDADANIIFGSTFDESLAGRMRVSLVAAGIDADEDTRRASDRSKRPIVSLYSERAEGAAREIVKETAPGADTSVAAGAGDTGEDNPVPEAGQEGSQTQRAPAPVFPFRARQRDKRPAEYAGTARGAERPLQDAVAEQADLSLVDDDEPAVAATANDEAAQNMAAEAQGNDVASLRASEDITESDPEIEAMFDRVADEGTSELEPSPAAKFAPPRDDQGPGNAAGETGRPESKPKKSSGFFSWISSGGDQAEDLFKKADRYYHGQGVRKNLEQAFRTYLKAAESGHAGAQNRVGWMYEKGEGVPADHAAAVKWYRKAAEQGHVNAMNDLGYMYRQGWGVPQSHEEAMLWFEQAASKYDSYAEYNMGQMFENGWGVEKDMDEAVRWFRRSAARGHEWAAKRLEELGIKS